MVEMSGKTNNRIAIILIGTLTKEKELSLKTLLKAFPSTKLCVASNDRGHSEIIRFAESKQINRDLYFCFHNLSVYDRKYLNFEINQLSGHYSFRSKEFKRLTSWKWLLLKDIFLHHHNVSTILFSDLDVYWRDSQKDWFLKNDAPNATVTCQDSADFNRENWFCTGIMFWERKPQTFNFLDSIHQYQVSKLNQDVEMDDESAFNEFLNLNPKYSSLATRLNKREYLTGFRLLFENRFPKKTIIVESVAFHANYILGAKAKKIAMRMYENYTKHRRIRAFFGFLSLLVVSKFNRVTERLKRLFI